MNDHEKQALFVYVNNRLYNMAKLIGDIYDKQKSEDNFL